MRETRQFGGVTGATPTLRVEHCKPIDDQPNDLHHRPRRHQSKGPRRRVHQVAGIAITGPDGIDPKSIAGKSGHRPMMNGTAGEHTSRI